MVRRPTPCPRWGKKLMDLVGPRHRRRGPPLIYLPSGGAMVPPLSLQSCVVVWTKPCPLQAFLPLQSFWADLQDDCPLQPLAPTHFTWSVAVPSWARALTTPVTNSIATALAISAFFAFIFFSSYGVVWYGSLMSEARKRFHTDLRGP